MLSSGLRLSAAALAALIFATPPASAGSFDVSARIGNSSLQASNGRFNARISLGAKTYRKGLNRRSYSKGSLGSKYRYKDRKFDYDYYDRRDRVFIVPARRREVVREVPVVIPPQPQPVVVEVPQPVAQPLDPQGSARIVTARGRRALAQEYELGAILPRNEPHVTLDHRRYDLPEPPTGQIYARVGRNVLRIDPVTRRIIAVVAN